MTVPTSGPSVPPSVMVRRAGCGGAVLRQALGAPARHSLGVPPCSLVVLAGLPGAGKTTLLRQLQAASPPGVLALDPEEVAERLRRRVDRVPYRVLRPAVHAVHLARVLRGVHGPAACLLTTDPMTSPLRRALLRLWACTAGRSVHVVLVDATEAQARHGQQARGRALSRRRMARHVVRAERLLAQLRRTGRTSFVDDVLVLPRTVARSTVDVRVGDGRLRLRRSRRPAA